MQIILEMEIGSGLFAPNVHTDCKNIFLEQMSQYLGTREEFLTINVIYFIKFEIQLKMDDDLLMIVLLKCLLLKVMFSKCLP